MKAKLENDLKKLNRQALKAKQLSFGWQMSLSVALGLKSQI